MRSPADASPPPLQTTAHGSGPMWFATPSSQWTSTTYSLPVSRRTPILRNRQRRLILHPHQIQSVRRRYRAAGGAAAGGECGGEVIGAPAAFADPHQRTHHRTHLAVQERTRGSEDRNRIAVPDHVELVERLLRRFRLAFGVAK